MTKRPVSLMLVAAALILPGVTARAQPADLHLSMVDLSAVETTMRELFEAWTFGLAGPEGVTYDGPWLLLPLADAAEVIVPEMRFALDGIVGVTVAPHTVVYRRTGPDTFDLLWPAHDASVTIDYLALGGSETLKSDDTRYLMRMVDGEVLPRHFEGSAGAFSTITTGLAVAPSGVGLSFDILGSTRPNGDGTVDLMLRSGTEAYHTDDGQTVVETRRDYSRIDIKGAHLDAFGETVSAFAALFQSFVDERSLTDPQIVDQRLGELVATLPNLGDGVRYHQEITGLSLVDPFAELQVSHIDGGFAVSGLSQPTAIGSIALAFNGFSSNEPMWNRAMPQSAVFEATIDSIPVADVLASLPDQLWMAPIELTRSRTGLSVNRLVLDYPSFSVEATGTVRADDQAFWLAVVAFDIIIDNPDGLRALLGETSDLSALADLADVLLPLGEPVQSAPEVGTVEDGMADHMLYRIALGEDGVLTLNGHDVSARFGLAP